MKKIRNIAMLSLFRRVVMLPLLTLRAFFMPQCYNMRQPNPVPELNGLASPAKDLATGSGLPFFFRPRAKNFVL